MSAPSPATTAKPRAVSADRAAVLTTWQLAYDMVGPAPDRLIRKAGALTPPLAC